MPQILHTLLALQCLWLIQASRTHTSRKTSDSNRQYRMVSNQFGSQPRSLARLMFAVSPISWPTRVGDKADSLQESVAGRHSWFSARRLGTRERTIVSMRSQSDDKTNSSLQSESPYALKELIGFPGLLAGDFQNPQDKVATARLSAFVPIELALRNVFLPLLEDASFFDNIGRGVQVSKEQYPTIHGLVVDAAKQLDISVPDVFVKADPRPNAYTLAFQGRRPFIVLHTSLIDLMSLEEVKAVIGHELGHLKCEHSLWITVLNILALGIEAVELLVPLGLRQLISSQLTQWRRSAELSCDRASLLVTQDESVVMSVLMKLTGGSAKLAGEMSAEEFARQAKDYDDATGSSWLGRLVRFQDENQLYPLPILRAREIQKYAQSQEYKSLRARLARPVRTLP